MASQPNIVSFDEVRRDAYARGRGALSDSAAARAAQTGRYIPSRDDVCTLDDAPAPRTPASARRASAARRPAPAGHPAASQASGTSDRRRAKAKSKATRAYNRQYGAADAAAEQAAAPAPRAAVYKGQMGAKQRQAARMQEQDAAAPARAARPKRHRALSRLGACAAVVACLLLACAFMYPAAQEYYQTIRANDQLEAERDALLARNEAIENEIEALSTDDGVEQAAREELGWVTEGEVVGTVSGLDAGSSDDEEEAVVEASIATGSVEMPDTWYSPLLDLIFGVE